MPVHLMFLIIAWGFFAMAAVDVKLPRINPIGAGLLLWVTSLLLRT